MLQAKTLAVLSDETKEKLDYIIAQSKEIEELLSKARPDGDANQVVKSKKHLIRGLLNVGINISIWSVKGRIRFTVDVKSRERNRVTYALRSLMSVFRQHVIRT